MALKADLRSVVRYGRRAYSLHTADRKQDREGSETRCGGLEKWPPRGVVLMGDWPLLEQMWGLLKEVCVTVEAGFEVS